MRRSRHIPSLMSCVAVILLAAGAANAAAEPAKKVGVMLVNHGSRSAAWRATLQQFERSAREPILATGHVHGVKTAFMEYTEPSVATTMKQFDDEGYTDVIVLPVFLTVSTHTFDDIPTILGTKSDPQSIQSLKLEGIARYTPKARTHFAPRLDYSALVKENVLRRARKLSRDPANEGLVLIAYGDETYNKQWCALLEATATHVLAQTGMRSFSYGWAGHIAHYDPAHTTRAVEQVLRERKRAVVVPVLVAFDEMFQVQIIGKGIAKVADSRERVGYVPDAILPDDRITDWVVKTVNDMASGLPPMTASRLR
jgi:hypothetical protein